MPHLFAVGRIPTEGGIPKVENIQPFHHPTELLWLHFPSKSRQSGISAHGHHHRVGCPLPTWLFFKTQSYLSISTRAFLVLRETFPQRLFWPHFPSCPFQKETPRPFRMHPGHQDLSSRLLSETVGCCCVIFCMWSFFNPNKGSLLQWRMLRPHNACCRRGLITQLHLSKCHFSDRP